MIRPMSSLLVLLLAPAGRALARDLVDVPVVDHFPLQIDKATLKRNGKVVSFSYVLAVPKSFDGRKAEKGEWISNEIEIAIDCKEETYSLGKFTVYGEAKAQGPVEKEFPASADSKPSRIYPRSTAGYLADFVCQ